ncbi:putative nuclease HARBI1 isoform X2 [Dreissena polymorpha]|uniref:putative nuclease HARBI1 isoform X2 n=1 Tax=Dreissena polymorpha TaxID=45954 RepID=UPI002263B873|nr:putative nuclease HARBI1 isoform X2 [Dreissena polymorpha]
MHQFIFFPASEYDKARVKREFYSIAGFPNVLGFVDCTHVKIRAPKRNEMDFVNRKGYHSVNIQMICDPQFLITDVVVKWPGSVHDSRIFRESSICAKFENGQLDGLLLGDSGYACRTFLLTPYLHTQTQSQERSDIT